jgi:hypothetical protein
MCKLRVRGMSVEVIEKGREFPLVLKIGLNTLLDNEKAIFIRTMERECFMSCLLWMGR